MLDVNLCVICNTNKATCVIQNEEVCPTCGLNIIHKAIAEFTRKETEDDRLPTNEDHLDKHKDPA